MNIKEAIEELQENKEEYEKLNPKNGWGSYDLLLRTFKKMLKCCEENLDGKIELS